MDRWHGPNSRPARRQRDGFIAPPDRCYGWLEPFEEVEPYEVDWNAATETWNSILPELPKTKLSLGTFTGERDERLVAAGDAAHASEAMRAFILRLLSLGVDHLVKVSVLTR
jgi:hypothetical protein